MNIESIRSTLIKDFKSISLSEIVPNTVEHEYLIDSLLAFIKYDVNESLLDGLSNKLMTALNSFSDSSVSFSELEDSLEKLATGFESFLKKIAFIKFAELDPKIMYGDLDYKGFIHTTLGNLMIGKVDKVQRNSSAPNLLHPIITYTFSDSSYRGVAYNKTRELRNKIHNSRSLSRVECIEMYVVIVTSYLFAVQENLGIINLTINPLFDYLTRIINDFGNVNKNVVELDSEERFGSFSQVEALAWKDNDDDIQEPSSIDEEIESNERNKHSSTNISVFNLQENYSRLWVIGEAGAGKSFSLKAIVYLNAKAIINTGSLALDYPIYISANQYGPQRNFRKLIANTLRVDDLLLENLMSVRSLKLVIDGYNEISKDYREKAKDELEHMLFQYNSLKIILSSRKSGFVELFNIPVFELLPLTDFMIYDYILKFVPDENKAKEVHSLIERSSSLIWDFARNPLMLQMLIRVIIINGKSPENRGKLFFYFTNWIYSRNQLNVIEFNLTEKVLASIAFSMRERGYVSIHQSELLDLIRKELLTWNYTGDIMRVYDQLVGSFLEKGSSGKIVFIHELILEYFAAVQLNSIYSDRGHLSSTFFKSVEWFEPIIMFSGIVEEASGIVEAVLKCNLILAARCVNAGVQVSQSVIAQIIQLASEKLSTKKKGRAASITCLLELGTSDALRVIAKLPIKDELTLSVGINQCQRPEIAVLKLLHFGLTGKSRIRQCLMVFYQKPISTSILNSKEIADAQTLLLEDSDRIEYRDLELLYNIGISPHASTAVKNTIVRIIEFGNTSSPIWRKAIQIAGEYKYLEENLDTIMSRLDQYSSIESKMCYSVFVVISEMEDKSKGLPLAIKMTRICFTYGYFGLAKIFISSLNLKDQITNEEIQEAFEQMTQKGKLGPLLDLSNIFTHINIDQYLSALVNKFVSSGQILRIFENIDRLHSKGRDISLLLSFDTWIKLINDSNLSHSFVKKIIKKIEGYYSFDDICIIKLVNVEKNFAFAATPKEETFFFRPKLNKPVSVNSVHYYYLLSEPRQKSGKYSIITIL
jgi:hypothetical protein